MHFTVRDQLLKCLNKLLICMLHECDVSLDLIKQLSSQAWHFYILHEQMKLIYILSFVCYAAVNSDSL